MTEPEYTLLSDSVGRVERVGRVRRVRRVAC
jgi:hypothetical protein